MLKKRIKYQDLDGNELVEDFYFNLTKAEIAELEVSHMTLVGEETQGGFGEMLQAIVSSGEGKKIIDTFKEILRLAYGKRSEDGKRFMKKPEYFEEFLETDAYSVLFMQLVTDADASAAFIRGIVPGDISGRDQDKPVTPPAMAAINQATKPKVPYKDLQEMSADELRDYIAKGGSTHEG